MQEGTLCVEPGRAWPLGCADRADEKPPPAAAAPSPSEQRGPKAVSIAQTPASPSGFPPSAGPPTSVQAWTQGGTRKSEVI